MIFEYDIDFSHRTIGEQEVGKPGIQWISYGTEVSPTDLCMQACTINGHTEMLELSAPNFFECIFMYGTLTSEKDSSVASYRDYFRDGADSKETIAKKAKELGGLLYISDTDFIAVKRLPLFSSGVAEQPVVETEPAAEVEVEQPVEVKAEVEQAVEEAEVQQAVEQAVEQSVSQPTADSAGLLKAFDASGRSIECLIAIARSLGEYDEVSNIFNPGGMEHV